MGDLLAPVDVARRTCFFAPGAGVLDCPDLAGAGFVMVGPFRVLGVRMAPALEKPPGETTRGGMTMTFAAWGGCTRE